MIFRATMLAAAIATIAAGCTQTSTAVTDSNRPPSAPSYDGGLMYGSGNRTEPADASSTTVNSAATADSLQSSAVERGGLMYGSGN